MTVRSYMEVSAATWDRARAMRKAFHSWRSIAEALGLTEDRLRREIDPGFAEHRREVVRNRRRVVAQAPREPQFSAGPSDRVWTAEKLERLLATIPHDDRDLTARLFGDPLPGRSALDQREAPRT